MAHVVPKREPCRKCNNPVFLAERLVINQTLYHRTCFRCARCNTVLSVGYFYETEKDHEFCCEQCPDEEKPVGPKVESNRLSIAQKIALFEKESSSVLRKSLSDEEKSKSLKRQSPANSNAFSSFMATQITEAKAESSDDDEKTIASSSESDDDAISDKKLKISDHKSVPATKELTHGKDTEAIAKEAQNHSESQAEVKDNALVGKKVENVPDEIDDIEMEFDKLVEEAEKSISFDVPDVKAKENKKIIAKTETKVEEIEEKVEKQSEEVSLEFEEIPVKNNENFVKDEENEEKDVKIEENVKTNAENEENLVKDEENDENKNENPNENVENCEENSKIDEKAEEKSVEIPRIRVLEASMSDYGEISEDSVHMETATVSANEVQVQISSDSFFETSKPEEDAQKVEINKSDEKHLNTDESLIEACQVAASHDTSEKLSSSASVDEKPTEILESSTKSNENLQELSKDDVIYPDDLNPFGDDEEPSASPKPTKRPSLNPFGSCSEDEDDKENVNTSARNSGTLPKPPRPPPPKTTAKTSMNPFGSDDEEEAEKKPVTPYKTPVPTPRRMMIHSTTPEPSPRSLSNNNSPGHSFKGSTSSLASSSDGMSLRRKKKAPAPPPPKVTPEIKTPLTTPRKKRPAPTPPTSTPKSAQEPTPSMYITANDFTASEDLHSHSEIADSNSNIDGSLENVSTAPRRLIPLEECLVEEKPPQDTEEVVYRRKLVPLSPSASESFENLERSKDNKEAQNRQRQSQGSMVKTESESTDSLPYLNKSTHGKWKRRKGPAPSIPGFTTPQRRILQMLPLQEIRQELEVIEVQQQGLEKQGVMLEKMIRERCEGTGDNRTTEELLENLPGAKNPKEVEELILQLFELVNEKNELFRRQAELMYLRRAHRLEEEQADVEYEIRTLMAQPEQNKTDSDKAKEEALIARLVDIVQLRNEVVDCLDRDRLREAEEDLSIKQRMESHTAKLDQDYLNQTPTKLSKKEKKKLKEAKKLKNKKLDADKDLDTSEKPETSEKKKKKKKFLF